MLYYMGIIEHYTSDLMSFQRQLFMIKKLTIHETRVILDRIEEILGIRPEGITLKWPKRAKLIHTAIEVFDDSYYNNPYIRLAPKCDVGLYLPDELLSKDDPSKVTCKKCIALF